MNDVGSSFKNTPTTFQDHSRTDAAALGTKLHNLSPSYVTHLLCQLIERSQGNNGVSDISMCVLDQAKERGLRSASTKTVDDMSDSDHGTVIVVGLFALSVGSATKLNERG